MKSNNSKLLQQLAKLTAELEFPWSDSDHNFHAFLWEVETLGEFTIENLFRSETPQFESYEEGGKIMKTANLDDYLENVWQKTQKHQTAIKLLKNNTSFLEVAEIRSLDNPPDTFKIILGQTKSGEWIGISPQIPADFEEYSPAGEMIIGEPLLPIYLPETPENFELFTQIEPLLAELDFCEENLLGGFTDTGYIVRLGEMRESMFNNLLDAIGFARTFPFQQFTPETDSEDDFDEEYMESTQALDAFLQ
jgi:Nuclease A inhibitor-like protein